MLLRSRPTNRGGYAAGAIDYLFKPVDPQMLTNKANIFFELARQSRDLASQRDELQLRGRQLSEAPGRLEAHRDNSPLAAVAFDPELCLTT